MNGLTNKLFRKNLTTRAVSSFINSRGTVLSSFNSSLNNSRNNNNNNSSNNNNNSIINNSRFYSTISPTSKPNYQVIFFKYSRKIPVHHTKIEFDKVIALADSGFLSNAESNVVRVLRNLQKEVDISSSFYGYPLYAAGLVSLKKGKYVAGEKFFRNSLSKYSDYDRSYVYRIETTNDLGLNLLRQGNSQEAERYLLGSYNLAIKYEVKLLPHIFTNIGEYYKELCLYDDANFYHGNANSHLILLASQNANSGIDLARCYLNRAQIFRLLNKIDEAENFLNMGSEILIQFFKERYNSPIPKHMDWSKLLLEVGHLYYAKGEYKKAKKKFISARNHFNLMKNSSVPDAIFNTLNLAIMEYNHPTLSDSAKYIMDILNKVEPLVKEFATQTSTLRMSKVYIAMKTLQYYCQQKESTASNTTSTNAINNTTATTTEQPQQKNKFQKTKISLFEPHHFQLTFVEYKAPLQQYNA
ncbi:hypothetical protein DICPUDRAFT_149128 [Dictyostelium purpureum]|uniref:MalT-like TPR region domain-containing protein n=1 Tax=Dictyostelium purpureum TaxID=5786 RepID=F0ZCX4_DICPU|nr:uncharacterized protein DICPUDRAFT_149128 [Dictyostelium purpureum]EGC38235.1 hypothetical protein DICPUDRAFT_149128 [Dictyostelium purpureum]|eukprot:XP_003285273.1 hypothetical protein DICPUDRAFT_149128 [Dictyostelium purpureum]